MLRGHRRTCVNERIIYGPFFRNPTVVRGREKIEVLRVPKWACATHSVKRIFSVNYYGFVMFYINNLRFYLQNVPSYDFSKNKNRHFFMVRETSIFSSCRYLIKNGFRMLFFALRLPLWIVSDVLKNLGNSVAGSQVMTQGLR